MSVHPGARPGLRRGGEASDGGLGTSKVSGHFVYRGIFLGIGASQRSSQPPRGLGSEN